MYGYRCRTGPGQRILSCIRAVVRTSQVILALVHVTYNLISNSGCTSLAIVDLKGDEAVDAADVLVAEACGWWLDGR